MISVDPLDSAQKNYNMYLLAQKIAQKMIHRLPKEAWEVPINI